jgi:hypothetical protein
MARIASVAFRGSSQLDLLDFSRVSADASRISNACNNFVIRMRPRAQSCALVQIKIGHIMQIPTWTKPALYGAGAGAIALAIVGFTWGGWVTGGTAQKMAESASVAAVTSAMTPYCIARSKSDPRSIELLAELKAAQGYNRRGVIEKAGWATPLGAEKPNTELARACDTALAAG